MADERTFLNYNIIWAEKIIIIHDYLMFIRVNSVNAIIINQFSLLIDLP